MKLAWLSTLAIASALALAPHPARAADAAGAVLLHVLPESLTVSLDGSCRVRLRVVNASAFGFFGDSVHVRVTPPAGRGAPTEQRLALAQMFASVSAGDSVAVDLVLGNLPVGTSVAGSFYGHDHLGAIFDVSDSARVTSNELEQRYPSRTAGVAGRAVEIVAVPSLSDAPSCGGLLILPGERSSPRAMLPVAVGFARAGVAVVIVGAPGVGLSQGPSDLGGPASRKAALAGLDTLTRLPGVDAGRLGVWGISDGGNVAIWLAAQRADLRAVIAESATYDLWARYRAADTAGRKAIEAQAGRDSAAWRERSPLLTPRAARSAVLVLHGEADAVASAAAAHAFADARSAATLGVESQFVPRGGHALSQSDEMRVLWRIVRARLAVSAP